VCWHNIDTVINYFDGLSPQEVELTLSLRGIVQDFHQSNIERYEQEEYVAKLTSHIWNQYGQRIFDLFDVCQTELWNQYADFTKNCGIIAEEQARNKGQVWFFSGLYNIC